MRRLWKWWAPLALAALSLSACAGPPRAALEPPHLIQIWLDVSSSNDALDQWQRIAGDLDSGINDFPITNLDSDDPADRRPTYISLNFIQGNSFRSPSLTLLSGDLAIGLYQTLVERNDSQFAKDWRQLNLTTKQILVSLTKDSSFTDADCEVQAREGISQRLGRRTLDQAVGQVCDSVMAWGTNLQQIESVIAEQSSQATGTDVFNALRMAERKFSDFLETYPNATAELIIASDMRNFAPGSQRNMRDLLTTATDRTSQCEAGRKQAELDDLDLQGTRILVRGLGNSADVDSDFAAALLEFWDCYFDGKAEFDNDTRG